MFPSKARSLGPATLLLALGFVSALALGCSDDEDGGGGGSGDDVADILQCEGECECFPEENRCSCLGGTDCIVTGAEAGVTLTCDGNARCVLECGADCRVECPGTAGCEATMGPNSEAVCNGTGNCAYTCEGDCSVECPGTSACTVTCAEGETCELSIESCPMVTECEDGSLACRTDCPA